MAIQFNRLFGLAKASERSKVKNTDLTNLLFLDGSQRKLPVNGRQHISENGTLHISKVNKKEDECFYECEISQDGGHSARTRIFLKVTSK